MRSRDNFISFSCFCVSFFPTLPTYPYKHWENALKERSWDLWPLQVTIPCGNLWHFWQLRIIVLTFIVTFQLRVTLDSTFMFHVSLALYLQLSGLVSSLLPDPYQSDQGEAEQYVSVIMGLLGMCSKLFNRWFTDIWNLTFFESLWYPLYTIQGPWSKPWSLWPTGTLVHWSFSRLHMSVIGYVLVIDW